MTEQAAPPPTTRSPSTSTSASTSEPQAPETIEGWYALHQIFSIDRAALRNTTASTLESIKREAAAGLTELAQPATGGWSAIAPLIGSLGDLMVMHLRPTLDELGDAQRRLASLQISDLLRPIYVFLSVTEVGMYSLAAHGPADPKREQRLKAEKESAHVQKRLFPAIPADMPYISFYPMSKRRDYEQNWYTLSLEERAKMMHSHGLTGRRYAGRVLQIISGAVGFDAWEWGVTLFAKDPLEFKKLVTEMRFDEASAKYAEFGQFYVGRVATPEAWLSTLVG
jgi:hydrogen peroxide-dependent heme synthase